MQVEKLDIQQKLEEDKGKMIET